MDAQEKASAVQQMFSACLGEGFFQFTIREAKLKGHRSVREFIVLLTTFSIGEMSACVCLHFGISYFPPLMMIPVL